MRIWVRKLILNKPAHNSIVSRLIFLFGIVPKSMVEISLHEIRYYPVFLFLVVCLFLPTPTNGMISYSDPTLGVGSVASFSCDPGFMISDATRSTSDCQADGQWSSIPPTCMGMFISSNLLTWTTTHLQEVALLLILRMEWLPTMVTQWSLTFMEQQLCVSATLGMS